jgi:hypothetical protein
MQQLSRAVHDTHHPQLDGVYRIEVGARQDRLSLTQNCVQRLQQVALYRQLAAHVARVALEYLPFADP